MKIYNVSAKVIPGNVVFNYKKYQISASTIFKPHSIIVYIKSDNPVTLYDAISIEDAINWINTVGGSEQEQISMEMFGMAYKALMPDDQHKINQEIENRKETNNAKN